MRLVNFFKPKITDEQHKPFPVDNQSFPYTAISNPRRFEELLYSIYQLKINGKEINDYDAVSLMGGVSEQGRDIVMFRNGKSHGVIQCKKYAHNLAKDEFGKEITKLVLYSLLDDRIIHDLNDFTYYIAVAKDFTADCRAFIDDFNNQILNESELNSWLSSNLKMPTLQALIVEDYKTEVLKILSKIKVKKIVPQDLDIELLTKPDLQTLFFSVRSVTDNTGTQKILRILTGDVPEEEISKQLYNGSISLISERNTFEGIEDSHIPRSETTQLIKWVQADSKKDTQGKILNICLLAAPAGYGKTVILKDFFSECRSLEIPVLGLKTDKLYSYTIADLQDSIGLSLPVFDFIERCKALYPLTVIVIDQIDALSQSMSSDRRFLEVFKGFIDRFENDANVKIIISVRNQDLNYDPTLRQLRKNNTIKVAKLSPEQVLEQLEKIGIAKDHISSKLLELLRIPNNLNIFSRIASSENSLKVTTIEQLYTELWNQKVLHIPDRSKTNKTKVRTALYTIADKMFRSQRITISVHQLEDFSDEIMYLESEQLVKREDKQLQFFHQSFYDFIYAKQFVENELDLLTYIKDSEQSIHIRSAVKMILAYLRDYDPIMYDKHAKQIILDDTIFFHIKHIVFLNLLSQSNPTTAEQNLAKLCLANSWNYNVLFFEQAYGSIWLDFAIENSLFGLINGECCKIKQPDRDGIVANFDEVMLNLKVHYLQGHIVMNNVKAWNYFHQIEEVKVIQKVLYFVTDWSSNEPFSMLAKCPNFINEDKWSYCKVLENISNYNIDFVLGILNETLPQNYKRGNRKRDYEEREILKSLSKTAPQKLFPILYECIRVDVEKKSEFYDGLIRDWTYSHTDLRDDEHDDGREFIYQLLARCLKATASMYESDFLNFFHVHKLSNHYAVLRLICFSLTGNEPKFTNEIIELFRHFESLGLLTYGDDLEYELRTIVQKGFTHMNDEQQNIILKAVRNYSDQKELRSWTDDKGKTSLHFRWGLAKYFWLLRLPSEVIQNNPALKTSFMELKRKFLKERDKPMRRSVIAGAVHSPLPVSAHDFMKKKHWLSSFRKYNSDVNRWGDDFLKGGKTELSSAFRNSVEKQPSVEKLEIINAVIKSRDIPIEYAINGLYGWTQSDADLNAILPSFLEVLKVDSLNENTYVISIAGRLASLEKCAPEVVNYLVETSLRFKNDTIHSFNTDDGQTGVNGLIMTAINTRHGSAANYLTSVGDAEFKDLVFDTVIEILKNGPSESRAAIYFHFYYLTRLDREKALDLFVSSLNEESDVHVIASSIMSLQYFRTKGLKILNEPFKLLIDSGSLGREDSNNLFTIFYGSYLHNQDGAKELLESLIDSGNCSRSKAIGDIIRYYYTVDDSKGKNDALLEFIMSKVEEEDFDDISWNFYDAGHLALQDIYEFLERFIKSKYFKLTDNFIEYLLTQSGKFPFLAVELFECALVNNQLQIDQQHSFQIDEKATKFIVSAFEAVTDNDDKSKECRKKLLHSFDKLITDLRFRRNQEKVLSELI